MKPVYFDENRYSYLVSSTRQIAHVERATTVDYVAKNPETDFERHVQGLFLEGQAYMQREQYQLALDKFRELMALIVHTSEPRMPVDPNQIPWLDFPLDLGFIDVLAAKAADILKHTPIPIYTFPPSLISTKSILPQSVLDLLKPTINQGLAITSYHSVVIEQLEIAFHAIAEDDFKLALQSYAVALENTPVTDEILQASLLHDMAILAEKADDKTKALEWVQRSAQMFEATKFAEAHVQALDTFTGILRRAGKQDLATEQAKKSLKIQQTNNINSVFSDDLAGLSVKTLMRPLATARLGATRRLQFEPATPNITQVAPLATSLRVNPASTVDAPTLMTMKYVQPSSIKKTLTIQGENTTAEIKLDANGYASVKDFLQTIRDTRDVRLLTDFWRTPIQMVAYLPHMYSFVIPMCAGDCQAAMGNLKDAVMAYRSILPYPFINKSYEIVKLWTRLAQVYLDMGDRDYRAAKDDINDIRSARTHYENIVLDNRTINPNSPLYQDIKFASIKTRVKNFLAAPDPVAHDDNPEITWIVLAAFNKLQQIDASLNFFGLPPDSPPPFSFEYMQNTARYFAQQASQIEQRYIQYMDQAENEQFRRNQLSQQAEVAKESVELEKLGVAEADAGINVANASVDYADAQFENAEKTKQEFESRRPELEEYAELEAFSSAVQEEEFWFGLNRDTYKYGGTPSNKPRSEILQALAKKRTKVSYDLESNKLQRAINSATAYKLVAEEQVKQAQARKEIADKRVDIADLQKKNAEQNRDFLDMREFSAYLWRELALQAKRLKQCYLDRATEIALLMERAYNAETEKNLHIIRSDYNFYGLNAAYNLLGADQLLADIDSFTYDYVTTIRTKKIPVKQVISLADSNPVPFQQLKTMGRCFFQTELADFDRQNPGMYLCKLRNVELVFVGLTNIASFAGSLRNVGVSRFRRENGAVLTRLYPSDVMALSQYDFRQDALAYRFNPNELRLFENNGIDTLWQLDLPLHANDFDYRGILDIQLVLYYDGFFSPSLEQTVIATLPTSSSASRAFSMRMSFFDELYYLKNKGEAEISFDAAMFPRSQENFKRTKVILKALGKSGTVGGMKLRLISANHGGELLLTTDDQGEVYENTHGQPLSVLKNESLLDTWTLRISADDNPTLVKNDVLDLTGLDDILVFFEYSFDYR